MSNRDKSNGYEGIASIYIAARGQKAVGVGASAVSDWSEQLPDGATVLDVGCGTGLPITKVLVDRGLRVYGVDASPSMVAAFHENFPEVHVQCSAAEDSDFFERTFDAVLSWGLLFLLSADAQRTVVRKATSVLGAGGRFLFTAPRERCTWLDAMTGQPSISLGYDEYVRLLQAEGMVLEGTHVDEGENYYYAARKV